jgi:hypothetical protein
VRTATPASSQDSDDGFQTVRSKRQRTIPPTQSTQGRASEAPARRGRPPLRQLRRSMSKAATSPRCLGKVLVTLS